MRFFFLFILFFINMLFGFPFLSFYFIHSSGIYRETFTKSCNKMVMLMPQVCGTKPAIANVIFYCIDDKAFKTLFIYSLWHFFFFFWEYDSFWWHLKIFYENFMNAICKNSLKITRKLNSFQMSKVMVYEIKEVKLYVSK